MTDTPKQTLVERVARSIAASIYRSEGLETMSYAGVEDYCNREWNHYSAEGQAAIAACHAVEMLGVIRILVAAKDEKEQCGVTEHYETLKAEGWNAARELLAKLDGKPSGGAV